jgi:hypothetical protein
MPIARGQVSIEALALGSRMSLSLSMRILLLLVTLGLAGCADTLTAGQPLQRFTDLVKPYNKTLTKEQQEAAITELRDEKTKHDQEAQAAQSEDQTATAANGAQTAAAGTN